MYGRMINFVKKCTDKGFVLRTGSVFFVAYSFSAWKCPLKMPTLEEFKWFDKLKSHCEARCQSRNSQKKAVPVPGIKVNQKNKGTIPPLDNEIRIIVIGATEFAKSRTGSILRQYQSKTPSWCYVETTKMKTLHRTINSKEYKIDIIDTPPNGNYSRMPEKNKQCEIQKAIALSAPGPHAFLLCIPATNIQSDCIDAIKPYIEYFNNDYDNFVIVVFTHYENFYKFNKDRAGINIDANLERFYETFKNECEKKGILKNLTKNYIVLNTSIHPNEIAKTMTQVINIIREREKNGEDFATGISSQAAETVLQNMMNKVVDTADKKKKKRQKSEIDKTLRDKVKMDNEYLSVFLKEFQNKK